MSLKLWHVPVRLAAGAFILNSGLNKRDLEGEAAAGAHGWASSAIKPLAKVDADTFAKGLSTGEMALGGALLAPFVPSWLAGVALTGFATGLLQLYRSTPGMTEADGIRPTEKGTPVAKDIWLLGIGLALVLDRLTDRR
jgi:hypothetical protein